MATEPRRPRIYAQTNAPRTSPDATGRPAKPLFTGSNPVVASTPRPSALLGLAEAFGSGQRLEHRRRLSVVRVVDRPNNVGLRVDVGHIAVLVGHLGDRLAADVRLLNRWR